MRTRRKIRFKNHTSSWSYKDYDTMVIGESIQIDHMSIIKNGVHMKHFQAWDRRSKYIDARIYSHAKSSSTKKFLMKFIKNVPSLCNSYK